MARKSDKQKRTESRKKRRGPGQQPGRGRRQAGETRSSPAKRRRRLRAIAVTLAALGFAAVLWWVAGTQQREFRALAEASRAAMREAVTEEMSAGRDHTARAQYDQRFPTSGAHAPTWVDPGVYDRRQPTAKLVHALEHGNIVIYYDQPGEAVMQRLREWAALYDNDWSGIVVTPAPGLGESLVLTAWTRRLHLDEFDPAMAAAFIDAYRGRGPENPVR